MSPSVVVTAYDPRWPERFAELQKKLWPLVSDFALGLEHVGSTSVAGLAAKPTIDLDIIIPDSSFLEKTIARLGGAGYEHRGNMGIEDRDAFRAINSTIKHNLYVCPRSSIALQNHLALRDTLRSNPALRDDYSSLKFALAAKYPDSIDDYIEGKTEFILKILANKGLSSDRLEDIRRANLAPKEPRR